MTLRAEPGHELPPIQRLRAAFKQLLRTHGLRIIALFPGDRVTGGDAGNTNPPAADAGAVHE